MRKQQVEVVYSLVIPTLLCHLLASAAARPALWRMAAALSLSLPNRLEPRRHSKSVLQRGLKGDISVDHAHKWEIEWSQQPSPEKENNRNKCKRMARAAPLSPHRSF